ncbi:hypothetical protein FOZ62_027202, partial [Perkinsus olseni]
MRTGTLLGLLFAAKSYRFPEEESIYYCNSEMRWPDVPPRQDGSGAELERVLVFARHGTRMPWAERTCWIGDETRYKCSTRAFQGFTNSPSGRRSPGFTRIRGKRGVLAGGSCVLGQLVHSGVQMHVANGEQLGAAYKAALGLGEIPSEPEVMFRSTDVPRVYQSAEALAVGMFPKIMDVDPSNLTIIIPDRQSDPMTPSATVCPRLKNALSEFHDAPGAERRAKQTSAERAVLGRITGRSEEFNTNETRDMLNIYDSLFDCMTTHVCSTVPSEPKDVPSGLGPSGPVFKHVEQEGLFWFINRYGHSDKMRKLAFGPFIGDLLEDLTVRDRRLSVFLGHDTGPAISIMDTMQLTWMDSGNECAKTWPPFGAM